MATSEFDVGSGAHEHDKGGEAATEVLVREDGLSTVSSETWRALLVAIIAIAAVVALVFQIPRALPGESDGQPTKLVQLPTQVRN